MAFLIEWMYDRKNAANHLEKAETFFNNRTSDIFWWGSNGRFKRINLKKIAWLRIKPAPKSYRPPVGQDD